MLTWNVGTIVQLLVIFPFSIICSRYQYLLFENVELTKKVFIKEQLIVKNLQYNSQELQKKISNLNININDLLVNYFHDNLKRRQKTGKYIHLQPLSIYNDRYHPYNINQTNIYSYEPFQTLSEVKIMFASLKGVIMLQETYNQDIKIYSKGHLRLKYGTQRSSRNIDSLQPQDLASMANIAFNYFNWYDTGIKYLKEAIDAFNTISNNGLTTIPNRLEKYLLMMKTCFVKYHNTILNKKGNIIGPDWKVFPYEIDIDTLGIASNQTSEYGELDYTLKAIEVDRNTHSYPIGKYRDSLLQNICNGNLKGKKQYLTLSAGEKFVLSQSKCHFIHHFMPFLKLGPFRLEVNQYFNFRTIIHDFFTDKEMDWMVQYSKPFLTLSRENSGNYSNKKLSDSISRYSNKKTTGTTVSKAVTAWFGGIKYNEEEKYIKIRKDPLMYKVKSLQDPYSYIIKNSIIHAVSKRIELATLFNITTRHGAQEYQITNYGLSGLVQQHHDSWGYEEEVKLVEERMTLIKTGDVIATFMGWFQETEAGGGTAFVHEGHEETIEPKKGAAAFWINLSSCHKKDARSQHGGCPVLKGSKWIINKWIFSWDQWKTWPCYLMPHLSIRPFAQIAL